MPKSKIPKALPRDIQRNLLTSAEELQSAPTPPDQNPRSPATRQLHRHHHNRPPLGRNKSANNNQIDNGNPSSNFASDYAFGHRPMSQSISSSRKSISNNAKLLKPYQDAIDPDELLQAMPVPIPVQDNQDHHRRIVANAEKEKAELSQFKGDMVHIDSLPYESNIIESIRSLMEMDVNPLPQHDVSLYANNTPINLLEDKTLKKIFTYLHTADLAICREVQRHWNALISQEDFFLDRTVYVLNIFKSYEVVMDSVTYDDVASYACLPFPHARFQFIDHGFLENPLSFKFRNSDNDKYFPSSKFFQSLKSIEFRNSFLLWQTIKAYLVEAVQVTSLKISNCHVSDFVPPTSSHKINEFEEFNAGNAVFGLKSLEIYEMNSLDNITSILRKFNGYSNQGVETLKISYHPAENRTEKGTMDERRAEAIDFCRELKTMISLCTNCLRVLYLDIQHEITLDFVGYHLSKELAALGPRIDLKEFQLSPGPDCWLLKPDSAPKGHVSMTMSSFDKNLRETSQYVKNAAASLVQFLGSQVNLEKLGLPCIEYPDASSFFKSVLKQLPCVDTLKYLAVPSAGFLPDNLFHQFSNLKGVKIGIPCKKDFSAGCPLFQHYTTDLLQRKCLSAGPTCSTNQSTNNELVVGGKHPQRQVIGSQSELEKMISDLQLMHRMEHLSISSVLPPDNFRMTMRYLMNLTSLEVNSGFGIPVITDAELQVCIRYLKMLTSLVVSCADKLTDFGLTGIPQEYCKLMFNNQRYYKKGFNREIWTSPRVTGRPLSDMKSLRKLVLMGDCPLLSDIGIGYGLAFNELRICHLPYSDNITSWGVETFGQNNPSLESLAFTGVNQFSKLAFIRLRSTHYRVNRGDASICGYFVERKSPFEDTLLMGLPSTEDVAKAIGNFGGSIKALLTLLARPIMMEFD